MENDKLVKVVSCYLMQGDNIVDFWLNKYFENGDSTDMTFKTQSEMILEIVRCIRLGVNYSFEIFEV